VIGGFYIFVTEPSEINPKVEHCSLLLGPFPTQAEADGHGPAIYEHINQRYDKPANLVWGVCEFYAPKLVLGNRNTHLWVNPRPIERA
jgi:hypothetical protein